MKSAKRAVIVAAGHIQNLSFLKETIHADDFVICADGGLDYCQKINITPNLLIGDLDSCKVSVNGIPLIQHPVQKDDTDTGLCIRYAAENGFSDVVLFGALGGRLDHTYANLQLLSWAKTLGVTVCIEDEQNTVFIVQNEQKILHHLKGCTVSVFAHSDQCTDVTLNGFAYPLDNAILQNNFPLGISNVVSDDTATISVKQGTLLVIVSHD